MSKAHHRPGDYGRFGEALLLLAISKLVVACAPFRWIAEAASWRGLAIGVGNQEERTAAVLLAVRRATRRLPWRSVCFDQGLAAHWMLRSRGIPSLLHYGVGKDHDRLTAHVWVSLGDDIVVGAGQAGRHACIATFPEDGR